MTDSKLWHPLCVLFDVAVPEDCLDTERANFDISFLAKKVDFSQWIANMGYLLSSKALAEIRHLYFLSCGINF